MTPHSPTPWKKRREEETHLDDARGYGVIGDGGFFRSVDVVFVLIAVNAHEALVEACKAVLGVLAPVINDVHDLRVADAGDDPRIVWPDLAVLEQVEAALTLAGVPDA